MLAMGLIVPVSVNVGWPCRYTAAEIRQPKLSGQLATAPGNKNHCWLELEILETSAHGDICAEYSAIHCTFLTRNWSSVVKALR